MIISVGKHVDETIETGSSGGRELDNYHLVAEFFLEFCLRLLPVGLVTVKLVYGYDERNVIFLRITQSACCSNLNTLLGVDYEDTILTDFECRYRTSDEVIGTRSINDIDLLVHKLGIKRSCVDRSLIELFEFIVVRNRVLLLNGAASVDDFSLEKHCFC